MSNDLSRRGFLAAGTGLFIVFDADLLLAQQRGGRGDQPGNKPGARGGGTGPWSGVAAPYPKDFNAYMRVNADGRVTCMVGKVELGQGQVTALAQCLAEELDVAFDSVDMVMGDTGLCPWDFGTGASYGVKYLSPVLRAVAAEARAVLLQMAAEQLQAPVERLQVKNGVVTDPAQNKSITYARMVQGKRIERHIENVPVKTPAVFTVIGRDYPRKDSVEKVTGKAKYAGDFTLPGMLYARIVRPVEYGSTLKTIDTRAAEKAGARIVRDGDLVAVLHERWDLADRALKLVKAEFSRPNLTVDDKTIFDHLLKKAPEPRVIFESGTLGQGEKLATTIADETYLNAYVAHAPIEPHNALASFEGGKFTIWASTTYPFQIRDVAAKELGVSAEDIRVIAPYIGGSFGGKAASPVARSSWQVIEAARIARAAGKPVQLFYDRAEEFFCDMVRPAAVVKLRAGVNSAGKIVLWSFFVVGAGEGDAKTLYDIPHQRTTAAGTWRGGNPEGMNPFGVGAWRGPSVNTNTFARESHIDILAHKAGMDPLEFRFNNMSDARMRRALEVAAKQFGWKPVKGPSGRGVGMACAAYRGGDSRMVTMAQVDVNKKTGHVQVKRIVCVHDHGLTVNPQGCRHQLEGGLIFSLGYALSEEVRFRGGEILNRDFDKYQIVKFSWVPKIEVVLIDNMAMAPVGVGEEPATTTGALIANAIFDATGARLLQLPMTPERVKAALKRV